MAEFRAMMKDVQNSVITLQDYTQKLLGNCAGDRKEAGRAWASLRRKEGASAEQTSKKAAKQGRK